jgi:excisionase family DNA binding protein
MDFSKAIYTPLEVAEMARVHPSTVLNWIASGKLYAIKLSERTYRIPLRAVIGLLEPESLTSSTINIDPNAKVELPIGEAQNPRKVYA